MQRQDPKLGHGRSRLTRPPHTISTLPPAAYGYLTEGPPSADTCTGHAHGELDRHAL